MSTAPSTPAKPQAPLAPAAPPRASAAALAAVTAKKQQAARPAPAAPAPAAAPARPTSPWESIFKDWPAEIPRRGVVVTQLNEPNPFKGFMLKPGFVLLERTSPDSMGGRFLLLPYEEIAAVKFTDPLKEDQLQQSGFQGKLSGGGG